MVQNAFPLYTSCIRSRLSGMYCGDESHVAIISWLGFSVLIIKKSISKHNKWSQIATH
jgi:hypothetical protein